MEPERWKDIQGFGGRYQVSSRGRVRSIMRGIMRGIMVSRDSRIRMETRNGKLLTPYGGRSGKQYVNLYDNRHRRHVYPVRELYEQAFAQVIF